MINKIQFKFISLFENNRTNSNFIINSKEDLLVYNIYCNSIASMRNYPTNSVLIINPNYYGCGREIQIIV